MRDLISELLDFRKQEQGYLKLKIEHKDIVPFIKEIYMSFCEYAATQQINYRFECPEQELKLWFDPVQLQKVIFNLISNAFKYTPKGGKINVSISSTNTQAHISIKDNGSGIPQEAVNKIFERFYQIESEHVGSGIGLSLIQRLVELHHGHIELDSEEGKGSTFSVYLPQDISIYKPSELAANGKKSEEEQVYSTNSKEMYFIDTEKVENEAIESGDKKRGTILIVEDNDELRLYMRRIFEPVYRVVDKSNAQEALEYMETQYPSLVLSDIMMPGMQGDEMCHRIKSTPATSGIPVILLTAKTFRTSIIEGLQKGADDYIAKPFDIDILKAKIQAQIENRRRLRQYYTQIALQHTLSTDKTIKEMPVQSLSLIHISEPTRPY